MPNRTGLALAVLVVILTGCAMIPESRDEVMRDALERATPEPTPTATPNLELQRFIEPPEHMAFLWWHWPSGQQFRTLQFDFTVHNDPGNFSEQHGLYLMLCYSTISDVGFYFGLQTNVHDPQRGYRGKGLIFSRWETRDLANAKVADPEEGWTQSSGHEGDFIGVRRSYDWGAGDYRATLTPDGADSDGEWFGLWITDKAAGETTWIGSLKFPYQDGTAAVRSPVYTTMEIYGASLRAFEIPEWHVSLDRPLGDDEPPIQFETGYSMFTDQVPNANVRWNRTDQKIHIQAGASTERTDPEQFAAFD
ncbi:MAG: hypothetical protein OXI80_08210 [Caldilineaceae bacterium]|uniref:Uncharacterized protein n=1 Tax=Caldilineaceae bacterium SB0664_bin_27 TaxID=2605260 RepID=A0A6B0YR99_9CHLR|nr:hypothetical protein [Caldilineaceae bacterium]MDE0337641.1 hypothetical protein [Caldilineaceae bacterium]MXY92312.1 hypothetical protein [Caldilineaceae bacterium SB0664_bin_27]